MSRVLLDTSGYAAIYDYLRRQGTPVSPSDLWIAASAAQHGLRILTLDGDFQRIPHVIVDKFEEPEREKGLMRLYCSILVERESQKPIIIGRRGEMIKAIGTAAREQLEQFFDTKVFLDLHVKVKSEWREDERILDEIFNKPT